ncbi:gb [Venturia nashicola]|uniref:Gb n=1 Tax=Venturia nashicola TaxID=86259 RepID=A0A4Z1PGD0_9PEZI|nr:gb [Venturia nashicola]TLD39756.1 gb [Venturia nashicola]
MPCANCNLSPPTIPHLNPCAKCKTTQYCSRPCRKAHFKQHKRDCVVNAAQTSRPADANGTSGSHHGNDSMSGRVRAGISGNGVRIAGMTGGSANVGGGGGGSSGLNGTGNFDSTGAFGRISATPMACNLSVHFEDPFTRVREGRFLDGRAESDVFKLLVDTWRLRMDDQYRIEKFAESGGCYSGVDGMEGGSNDGVDGVEGGSNDGVDGVEGGSNDGIAGFRHFLEKIVEEEENRRGLPRWWNGGKREACVSYAIAEPTHSLTTPTTRASIESYYGRPCLMYLQLRTFGAWLYEKDLKSMNSASVFEFMIDKEKYGGWPDPGEVDRRFGWA